MMDERAAARLRHPTARRPPSDDGEPVHISVLLAECGHHLHRLPEAIPAAA